MPDRNSNAKLLEINKLRKKFNLKSHNRFAEISAKCHYVGKYYGRWIFNFFILESRVVRFIPNNFAVLLSPLIFQLVKSEGFNM